MNSFNPGFGFGFDLMFSIIPILVVLGFIFVIGSMIFNGAKYAKDKTKPIIPAHARIAAKRTHVWGDHSHTEYYATFELDNGVRMELKIPSQEIGYLAEGDSGILEFQGDIFVSFKR